MEKYISNIEWESITPEQVEEIGSTISSAASTILMMLVIAIVAIFFVVKYKKEHKKVSIKRRHVISRTAFGVSNFAIMYNAEDNNAHYLKIFDISGTEIAEYHESPGQQILGVYEDNGKLCMKTLEETGTYKDWYFDAANLAFVE